MRTGEADGDSLEDLRSLFYDCSIVDCEFDCAFFFASFLSLFLGWLRRLRGVPLPLLDYHWIQAGLPMNWIQFEFGFAADYYYNCISTCINHSRQHLTLVALKSLPVFNSKATGRSP